MHVGYQFEPLPKGEVTHTQFVRYAGASGDFNPIHTDLSFAQKAGLEDVIAHGMLLMGFIGQAIGTWFPVDDLAKFSVRFKAMTRPGERITVKGSVVDQTQDKWVCEAVAINEREEVKVSAKFEVRKIEILC